MEEKIAMLMSLILVVLISNFTLNMVAAESYCHGQCRVLVNACKRLILRQSPTAECCLRIRRTPMWCICSIITPQLAALVNANDVSDAVGVICQCGRPVACSTKCGSKRNRRRRNHKILIDIVCVYFLFVELTLCRDTLFSPLSSCPKSEVFNRLFAIVFSAVFAAFLSASSSFLTIDDKVKALLEERLKDLRVGKIPENNDNPSPPLPVVQTQKKSVSIPALAATPGKVFGPKKNLAKELDKESGVRRTLDEEFGSVTKATDLDSQPLDFVVISPAKATKDDKDAKMLRLRKKDPEAKKKEAEGKKKKQAEGKKRQEAEGKKKEAEAKKKEAEGKKKKEAEGKKKEAELKKKQEAELKKRKEAESKNKEYLTQSYRFYNPAVSYMCNSALPQTYLRIVKCLYNSVVSISISQLL
uniref:Bifunctional inhibitor/plant lipid transfer protein/seed storage helical domain-containing protein n=1 Tax=Brassica oleracea var. oleracea TaxID=109376 RepID=A0A0D3E8R0_BRAOL